MYIHFLIGGSSPPLYSPPPPTSWVLGIWDLSGNSSFTKITACYHVGLSGGFLLLLFFFFFVYLTQSSEKVKLQVRRCLYQIIFLING